MTIKQAYKFTEARLESEGITNLKSPAPQPFPGNSQYFGRSQSRLLQIRVSDHPSKYPRAACAQIVLVEGMSKHELNPLIENAIRWLANEEDEIDRQEGNGRFWTPPNERRAALKSHREKENQSGS